MSEEIQPMLSDSTCNERMKWNSIEIYREAQSIEMMLIKNGAIPNKDYTILELFKIAAENLKTEALLEIGSAIGDLQELKSK